MQSNRPSTEFFVLYGATLGLIALMWGGLGRWANPTFVRGLLLGLACGHLLPSLYAAWRAGFFVARWWHRVLGVLLLPPVSGAIVYALARPMARGFTSGALLAAAFGSSLLVLRWPRFQQPAAGERRPDQIQMGGGNRWQ